MGLAELMGWIIRFGALIVTVTVCLFGSVYAGALLGDWMDKQRSKNKIRKLRKEHSKWKE